LLTDALTAQVRDDLCGDTARSPSDWRVGRAGEGSMPYDEPEAGLTTPVRNRYVFGQLLGVDDLRREQEYASAKRRLANRLLHGYGVVAGLDVGLTGGSTITVSPG